VKQKWGKKTRGLRPKYLPAKRKKKSKNQMRGTVRSEGGSGSGETKKIVGGGWLNFLGKVKKNGETSEKNGGKILQCQKSERSDALKKPYEKLTAKGQRL